ncbi:MAG TPA: CBS domain-containing protein [Lacunisphaera sp.]
MKIRDIMTSGARCVGPDAPLTAAASIMRELDVGALPVCENERLAGIITDRDIAIRGIAESRDPSITSVRTVMSPEIVYAFEDQNVEEAAHIMELNQIRRLPVLNREKRLVGIVSLGDVAKQAGAGLSGEALREISQPAGAHA